LRAAGEPVTGLTLVPTPSKYSERGMEYVNTLAGIIRVNELAAADDSRLMELPLLLIVDATDQEDAVMLAAEIEDLRASGELVGIISGMGIVAD